MASSTYQDIIDSKIEEWQNRFDALEKRMQKAGSTEREKHAASINELRATLTRAREDLRQLQEQENEQNTMEIKEKMLKLFNSVDKELSMYQEKTPYML